MFYDNAEVDAVLDQLEFLAPLGAVSWPSETCMSPNNRRKLQLLGLGYITINRKFCVDPADPDRRTSPNPARRRN